ncbi:MAG: dihydrolipoyl dehydrogenase [Deltaproteobacteria bacterium]|jgi:dihydrolipoamide dehydrogenase|nr:dihydrolipoyl dehydrogenase [Deltaproteobacteria bacterium]
MINMNVDVAIIGTGTAGMTAYRAVRKHTNKIALIEGNKYGTTCARVGCMPSKLLIAAAEASHSIQKSSKFGVYASEPPIINGKEVMQRVRDERDRFVGFVLGSVGEFEAEHKIWGMAKFVDDNTLAVGEKLIHAETFVIATGSSPKIMPQFFGLGDRLIVNDDVFEWIELPKSVAVFGSGVIGLELGQALHRLGVKVKVFGRPGRIRPITDPEIVFYAKKTFQSEFYLDSDSTIEKIWRDNNEVVVQYLTDGEQNVERFEYLLAATGRKPNIENLDLSRTSLQLDSNGVPVFDPLTMQCGKSHIFIAGDINNDLTLLHEAADEGKIAGENAATFPHVTRGVRRSMLSVVFTEPQIAVLGETWEDLHNSKPFITGRVSFEGQGRSRVMLKNKGLLHVYADPLTKRLLGAEIFGPDAEHLGHLLAWSHQQAMTIPQILEMPFYHPVVEEGLRTAIRDADSQLKNN